MTQAFFGVRYAGPTLNSSILKDVPLPRQLQRLDVIGTASTDDFVREIEANWKCALCNFGGWSAAAPELQGFSSEKAAATIQAIRAVWAERSVVAPLPNSGELIGAR